MEPILRRVVGGVAMLVVAGLIAGCASGRAFSRGEEASRAVVSAESVATRHEIRLAQQPEHVAD